MWPVLDAFCAQQNICIHITIALNMDFKSPSLLDTVEQFQPPRKSPTMQQQQEGCSVCLSLDRKIGMSLQTDAWHLIADSQKPVSSQTEHNNGALVEGKQHRSVIHLKPAGADRHHATH
jgi:hypothetical protein